MKKVYGLMAALVIAATLSANAASPEKKEINAEWSVVPETAAAADGVQQVHHRIRKRHVVVHHRRHHRPHRRVVVHH